MPVSPSRWRGRFVFNDTKDGELLVSFGMGARRRIKKIHLSTQTTAAETDTTWDLPAGSLITGAWLYVTTAEATESTKTIDVGLLSTETGGDADGLIDGASVAATGLVSIGVAVTAGGSETYYSSTAPTRGLLLRGAYVAGTNSNGDFGLYSEKWHDTDSTVARSVSWTASGNQSEFVGDLYIEYIEVGNHE